MLKAESAVPPVRRPDTCLALHTRYLEATGLGSRPASLGDTYPRIQSHAENLPASRSAVVQAAAERYPLRHYSGILRCLFARAEATPPQGSLRESAHHLGGWIVQWRAPPQTERWPIASRRCRCGVAREQRAFEADR